MYLYIRRLSITAILFFSFHFLSAQINSPYSRFGIGNLFPASFEVSNGMGGISATLFNPYVINYLNPASYAGIRYAMFDVGGYANVLSLETVDEQYTSGDGNLSHFAFGFPMLKKLRNQNFGISFGLIPYSSFQYNIINDIPSPDDALGTTEYNYIGNGDLYQFYGGLGYQINSKPDTIPSSRDTVPSKSGDTIIVSSSFSIGANIAYLFGGLSSYTYASFPDQENSQTTKLSRENRIGGMIYNFGLGYEFHMFKNKTDLHTWRFGASMNPDITVNGLQSVLWTNILRNGNYEFVTDTLYSAPDTSGSITLPLTYRAGISYSFNSSDEKKNQYTISSEFTQSLWDNYEGFQSSGSLTNSWRLMLGSEFIPKTVNKKKASTSYRVGLFTGTSNLQIDGQQLRENGLTFGFGIPIGTGNLPASELRFSKINISATIGTRGSTDYIKETFYNFGIGFTLADAGWFRKYRLN